MWKTLFLFLWIPLLSFGQNSFTKEFSFTIDNDLFVSYVNDKYYSSGLFFEYRYLDSKSDADTKTIRGWSLNQQIYTPYKSIIRLKSEHDRPFAAYLFTSYKVLKTEKNRIKNRELQLGVLGPAAFGKQFQKFIHDIYGFAEPIGWKYQIKNTLGINFNSKTIKKLGSENKKFTDFFYSYGYSIGTIHTNAHISLQGRIGFKELSNFNNSIAFGTHLNHKTKRNAESFLIWKLRSMFVAYDATIEGSLFNNDSPVTFGPNKFHHSLQLGYLFTVNQWNFGYTMFLNSNERSDLTDNNGHVYGRISVRKIFN